VQQNFAVAIYKFFGFESPNATASHAQTLMLRGQPAISQCSEDKRRIQNLPSPPNPMFCKN